MKKFVWLVFASAFIFTFFNLINTESANSYESYQTRRDNHAANTEFGDSYGIFYSKAVFIGDREERDRHLPPGTFIVREDQLDLWLSWFEPPTEDELG